MARRDVARFVRRIVTGGALLSLAAQATAQRLPITYYSTSSGLAHYVVNRIVRDSHGFLWFCTRDGLSRFDGREFVNWGVDDGLPVGDVNALLEMPDGMFWLGTARGLVRFNPSGRRQGHSGWRDPRVDRMFTTYIPSDDPRTARISAVQRDRDGAFWVGTAGGLFRAVVHRDSVAFTAVNLNIPDVLQSRGIGSLLVDRFGALWIGANSRLYRRTPAGDLDVLGEADGIPRESISGILQDSAGRIWVTPMLGGLLQLTNEQLHARPRVVRHLASGNGFPSGAVSDVMQDSRGTLWIATAGALVGVTSDPPIDGRVTLQTIAAREGLRAHGLSALAEDLHGNLWAGVIPYGVAKLSRSGFSTFGPSDSHAAFMSLVETATGDLVAFSQTAGTIQAQRFDGQSFVPIAGARPRVSASWAWNQMALQSRAGEWWFGGREGIIRYNAGLSLEHIAPTTPAASYSSANGLAADTVIRMFEDRRADVWIGTVGQGVTRNGLSLWNRTAATPLVQFTERDGLPSLDRYYVSSFAADRGGNVWLGFSGDAGLARYDGARFVRYTSAEGVPEGQIRNLTLDSEGRLWAASYRDGVIRVDHPESSHPEFHVYTTRDGLSSNETIATVESAAGDLYIGTARGLDKLHIATGRFTHFSATDGVPESEMWSALGDRHGILWFVYSDAILRVVPEAAQATPPAPEIFISSLSIDGRPRDVSAVGDRGITSLQLRNEASMRVDLVAPWFGTADDVLYQYRLRPEDAWSTPSLQRSVTFASLTPGRYTFSARAVTNEGRTSAADATIAFTVVAPVWRRPWFVLVALISMVAVTYLVSHRRVSRLLEVANMRTRIATDLHDDIGANLTRIAVLTEVARQRHALAGGTGDPLASIAALSRESVTAMGDIVWAISPKRDHVSDLVRKMREHADETLSACDIRLAFTVVGIPQDEPIGLDVRRDVFLIFKEAINNAARHSSCSAVDVTFGTENGSLVLRITDNGKGFDDGADTDGNGLVNMRRRAAGLGGQLTVQSRRGTGTTIDLVAPLKVGRGRRRLPS